MRNFKYHEIRDHMKRQDEIEDFLAQKAREFDALTERKIAERSVSFESFEWFPESKCVSVTFGEHWRYGGYEAYTISLPFNAIEKDMAAAAKEANDAAAEKEARRREALEAAQERSERAQLTKLQEKYG